MNLKDLVSRRLTEYNIKKDLIENRISPSLESVGKKTQEDLLAAFSGNDIPGVDYMSPAIASEYQSDVDKISILLSVLADNAKKIYGEHKLSLKMNESLYERTKLAVQSYQKEIDRLMNFNCYNISSEFSNQTDGSLSGKIGDFVVLPYHMQTASVYSGNTSFYVQSSGEVTFSNLESISSIPMMLIPSLKVQSKDKEIKTVIQISIDKTTTNAVHIKFENQIRSLSVKLLNNGNEVYSQTTVDNAILLNMLPKEITSVEITLIVNNPNTDKPVSIQLGNIAIYSNILFVKSGTFESKQEPVSDISNIYSASLSHTQHNTSSDIMTQQLISISAGQEIYSYSKAEKDFSMDVSLYRYRNIIDIDMLNDINNNYNVLGTPLCSFTAPMSSLNTMDYRNANICHGIVKDFATIGALIAKRYENWTLTDNYYSTHLMNFEDDVFVNLGSSRCIINGKPQTGTVKIPIGISIIEVHVKDIDLTASPVLRENTLNSYNYAYMFTGVPEYNSIGEMEAIQSKQFTIKGPSTVSLGGSFMPYSETITDQYGNIYKAALTKAAHKPGTYCIEPHYGKVKINPMSSNATIFIQYRKSSQTRKPCGILFNRLLTFASMSNLLSTNPIDNTLFSYSSQSSNTQYILLPPADVLVPVSHSQLLYNNYDENTLYVSAKVDMRSNNKYITPIINKIFISVK